MKLRKDIQAIVDSNNLNLTIKKYKTFTDPHDHQKTMGTMYVDDKPAFDFYDEGYGTGYSVTVVNKELRDKYLKVLKIIKTSCVTEEFDLEYDEDVFLSDCANYMDLKKASKNRILFKDSGDLKRGSYTQTTTKVKWNTGGKVILLRDFFEKEKELQIWNQNEEWEVYTPAKLKKEIEAELVANKDEALASYFDTLYPATKIHFRDYKKKRETVDEIFETTRWSLVGKIGDHYVNNVMKNYFKKCRDVKKIEMWIKGEGFKIMTKEDFK